ncbi:iron-siderophore ABC transporter substrate-binding protein [Streptomyces piniterrae]|uniref:Iron-siderophore ABC transporter substrate-binding protein n=1 Tax=Streptomyces piniterrae TaxID=2571125 RepID=A0A4U0NVB5_9ACTN|nr:iron-siderophore ABC transporter substrate-binding protein [Streptomyces piniterrae]TJZ54184.1 iron-siderophore ABC transporter substrate-binding protein [Streptomyces piniterrae]
MRSPSRRPGVRVAAAVAALALATGLAACGNDSATKKDSGSKPAAEADSGFPRSVKHHKGTTKLEARPERIVALDPSLVEAALALDGKLVGGVGSYGDKKTFPPYLGDSVKNVKQVGPLESPDLESIAALEPDLIVSASVRHDALYDELSEIAPTVFVETTGPTWKDNITKLGEALGAEQKAKDALAAYEKRAAAIGKAINKKADNPEISVVRFMDGPTRLTGNASFTGIVLSDMGLARPKAQDVDEFAVEVGEEQIRKADGDHIFVSTYEGGDESKERFLRNPLWRQLDAVKNKQVHQVNDATWMLSVSLQGANLVLDDMAKTFGVDPQRG